MKQNGKSIVIKFIRRWNVWAVSHNPNAILMYFNNSKGVIIAVLGIGVLPTDIWGYDSENFNEDDFIRQIG